VNIHALVLVALCRSAGPAHFNFSSVCRIQRAKLSVVGHSLNEMSVTRGAVEEAPQQSVRRTSINSSAGSINRFSSRCKVTPLAELLIPSLPQGISPCLLLLPPLAFRLALVALCRSAGPARFYFSSFCRIQRAKSLGVGHSLCAGNSRSAIYVKPKGKPPMSLQAKLDAVKAEESKC
jgi:hypothetical protein